MVEAVHAHIKYDSPITKAYHRIAERRGKKTTKVATTRMLLEVRWSVLRKRRP